MVDKIINYSKKHHTLRAYQVIITVLFASLTIAMLFINTFYSYTPEWTSVYRNVQMETAILWATDGFLIYYLTTWLTMLSGIVGITFIWLNRPNITLVSLSGIFLTLLTALLIEREFMHFNMGYVEIEPSETFYVILASFIVLVVFVILAIKSTKEGARPPRPLKTVRVKVVENTANSEADEIRKLKALLDDGIITEDEFNQKKKKILGL